MIEVPLCKALCRIRKRRIESDGMVRILQRAHHGIFWGADPHVCGVAVGERCSERLFDLDFLGLGLLEPLRWQGVAARGRAEFEVATRHMTHQLAE